MTTDPTTDLIDRYLHAVGQALPRAQREDITRELRTLIEDKLEEPSHARSEAGDATAVAAVLRELGEPRGVAAKYHPRPQHLVGPRFYPLLLRLVRIGAVALAVAALITALLDPAQAFTGPGLLKLAGRYFGVAVTFFGELVLIFAILERLRAGSGAPASTWDPCALPPVPASEEDQVSAAGLGVEIVLVALILGVLNFAPHWIGVLMVSDSHRGFLPLSELGVQLPVLAINLWLALALILKIVVLAQRRWTRVTRCLEVAVGAMAVLVAYLIATHSRLHAPAGIPQLDPAMHLLGRLFLFAPFAIAIQPVLRIVRLLRPAQRAAVAGR